MLAVVDLHPGEVPQDASDLVHAVTVRAVRQVALGAPFTAPDEGVPSLGRQPDLGRPTRGRAIRPEVVVRNRSHEVLAAVQLEVVNQIVGEDLVVVVMRDATTALTVSLRWPRYPEPHESTQPLATDIALERFVGRLPAAVYPVARFMGALRAPNTFQLFVAGQLLAEVGMNNPRSPIDADLVEIIRRAAFVQHSLTLSFPLPDRMTVRDASQLRLAERLLRGESVNGTWTDLTVEVGEDGEATLALIDSGDPMLVEVSQTYSVEVAEVDISLGEAWLAFDTARLDPLDEREGRRRRLIPAARSTYSITLENPPHRELDDPYGKPVNLDAGFIARATRLGPTRQR